MTVLQVLLRQYGLLRLTKEGFPGGPVIKSLPCNPEDTSSIPDLGRPHMP